MCCCAQLSLSPYIHIEMTIRSITVSFYYNILLPTTTTRPLHAAFPALQVKSLARLLDRVTCMYGTCIGTGTGHVKVQVTTKVVWQISAVLLAYVHMCMYIYIYIFIY